MSDRPRVFVARVIPDEGLDPIRAACDTDLWNDELPPPRDELLRRVDGVDGVLTLLTDRVDAELLDAAGPQLRHSTANWFRRNAERLSIEHSLRVVLDGYGASTSARR